MPLISDFLDDSYKRILRPSGGCHNCPRKKVDFVPATLVESKILFLGEAPGETEVKEQEGFTGSSGTFLRKEAREVGIEVFSLSNVLHCRPPNNRTPTAEEIKCCLSQFVLDEIRGYDIVVMCGAVPLQALFPKAKAKNFRGNVAWHSDFPGQRFYAVYHPAFILRRRDKEGDFRKQMERLARISRGEETSAYQIFQGGGTVFWEEMQKALESPLISLDLETNSLESWKVDSRIRSLALSADGKTVLFAHAEEPHWLAVLGAVRGFLERPEKHVVGANIGFDLDFLEEEIGFRVKTVGIHDVFPLYYELKQYKMPGLKELVSRELDGYRHLIHHPDVETDLELLSQYNAEDVVFPYQLFHEGISGAKPKVRDMLMRVSGPSGYVLRHLTKNGMYLRQDYWRGLLKDYEEREKVALAAWEEEDSRFIPTLHNKGKGLHEYLFKILGVPADRKTEKGKPSTDDVALKEWVRLGYEPLRHLLTLRTIEKILTTYLRPYETHVGPDGRIHSQYTSTFTDSARSSSRKPNVQNIPRDSEIRDLFGAPPGFVLMESDLSQIEFRIMVCLAQDPTGINAYLQGFDAHTQTAMSFCSGAEPTKLERTWAKVINFALCYGGDAYKVQQWARDEYGLNWTMRMAQEFVRAFFGTYVRFKPYHTQCDQELIHNRGWFESATGHTFLYEDWDHPNQGKRDHALRAHLNARAQGPAAQIMFLIMIHANRLFVERNLGVRMVNTVHDSLIMEVPEGREAEVVEVMEEAKDIAYAWVRDWFIVPLEMEHEVGPSWGSLKEWTG